MLVVLKIPVVYLCAVVWWAIRAEPDIDEGASGAFGDGPDERGPRPWWQPPRRWRGPRPDRARSRVARGRAGARLARARVER